MKLLTTTRDGQGKRSNDFCFAEEGEIAYFGSRCSGARADDACGCARVVGYWKTHTGNPSLRWADAVREALCFGWIDGQRRSIDTERHMQRFTPRKSRRWSAVNVALVAELEAEGCMTEAGRRAFAARDASEEPYSTSKRPSQLPPEFDARLRRDHPAAAVFWDSTPPSYRKMHAFWISDAKRPETREHRFRPLVEACAASERLR